MKKIFLFIGIIIIFSVCFLYNKNNYEYISYKDYWNDMENLNQNNTIKIEKEDEQKNLIIYPIYEIKNEISPLFELSEYEFWVTCCMVAGESGGESYDGQWAVAQCIYQACINDNLQPSEVKIQYQYSGWNENLEFTNPKIWIQIQEIVTKVFYYGEMYIHEEILFFYSPRWMENGVSEWHESLRFITEIGNHRFFALWN